MPTAPLGILTVNWFPFLEAKYPRTRPLENTAELSRAKGWNAGDKRGRIEHQIGMLFTIPPKLLPVNKALNYVCVCDDGSNLFPIVVDHKR
jgi:hypothetical protein